MPFVLVKSLAVYLDHFGLLTSQELADDVALSGNPPPSVLSPIIPPEVRKHKKIGSEEEAVAVDDGG